MMDNEKIQELQLSTYNYMLAEGEKVRLAPMEEYYSYGTPEELKRYL